ncbi:protein of unknown function [Paracoccus tibetensis]|uniref:Type IV methyl-directed restriction enzyme EcoKMcrB subunit DNA-binding domain-containing protein n=1 Tax=Paracoccus tibetensis TaxID=336292 RepID=A0A1G5J0C1_9RHOB|nr:protein of unknown function [Paracoccus tibetensis]
MAGSAFARFFRVELAQIARAAVAHRPERLLVRASTGAPGWAAVPWMAFFAPHVTRSMRRGLYVAIFIDATEERIVLALQHGAADALTALGHAEGLAHLRALAAATRAEVRPGHGLSPGPLHLGSTAALPQGYEAGSALWRAWEAAAPDGIAPALQDMLDLYRGIVGPRA